jgi:hypothetical protein
MLSKQYFSYIHAVNKLTYNKIELLTSIWIATEKKDIYTYVHSDNPILFTASDNPLYTNHLQDYEFNAAVATPLASQHN